MIRSNKSYESKCFYLLNKQERNAVYFDSYYQTYLCDFGASDIIVSPNQSYTHSLRYDMPTNISWHHLNGDKEAFKVENIEIFTFDK